MLARLLRRLGRFRKAQAGIPLAQFPLRGYRLFEAEAETLEPINATAPALPPSLIIDAGQYSVAGKVFDLSRDGLYRFFSLPSKSEQRIVCTGGLNSLFSSVGYLWAYGNADNAANADLLADMATKQRIVAGCNGLSELICKIATQIGVPARPVCTITLCGWNGQDDGHTLVELCEGDGNWFAYDPSFNCCFRKNGARLNIVDLCRDFSPDVEFESFPGNSGHGIFRQGAYDYAFWVDERMISLQARRNWYRRVLGTPMILHGGAYHFSEENLPKGQQDRLERHYRSLSRTAFNDMFYAAAGNISK